MLTHSSLLASIISGMNRGPWQTTVSVVTESYTTKHILKDTFGGPIYLWLVQWTETLNQPPIISASHYSHP